LTLFTITLLGCAGPEIVREKPLTGGMFDNKLELDASFETSKGICRKALQQTGFTVIEERDVDRNFWFIIGDMSWGLKSWGPFVRIVLERSQPNLTKVHINNDKKLSMNRSEDLVGVERRIVLNIQAQAALAAE